MRRLLPALLLLAACVSEPPPSPPIVWYSVAPLPTPPRVGTIDRERIVEAYYASDLFHQYSAALSRERERAERAGDDRQAAILRMQENTIHKLRERQLDGESGVANIIMALEGLMPAIAAARGIDIIVETGTWSEASKNVIDVTDDVVAKLPPPPET